MKTINFWYDMSSCVVSGLLFLTGYSHIRHLDHKLELLLPNTFHTLLWLNSPRTSARAVSPTKSDLLTVSIRVFVNGKVGFGEGLHVYEVVRVLFKRRVKLMFSTISIAVFR